MQLIKEWFRRNFSNPQVVFLALLLGVVFGLIMFMGNMLAPLLAALVIAYLLDGIVLRIQRHKAPRLVAVVVVYVFFMVSFLLLILGVVPNMFQQTQSFVLDDLPEIVRTVTPKVQRAYERYDDFKNEFDIRQFTGNDSEEAPQEEETALAEEPQPEPDLLNRWLPVEQSALTNQVAETGQAEVSPQSPADGPAEVDDPLSYSLHLVVVDDIKEIPTEGARLVITARIRTGDRLHFRIFDAKGKRVLDESENKFPDRAIDIQELKSRLAGLWDQEMLPGKQESLLLRKVLLITGQIKPLIDFGEIIKQLDTAIASLGRKVGSNALSSIAGLVTFLVYLVLVPVLVFFFLKDKERIIRWVGRFMPKESQLAARVWHDVNIQTSNYIRGKFWEIIIVWSVTHITFSLFGLKSALLLSLFVGLSVLVPYVGAAVMYLPIALIAFYQFGWGSQFLWIIVAYSIIQLLDGNLLAPVLLSEVTNIHPVAIIVSIVVFGGLWGFWGVFFAIPLATLINAVINAWPEHLASAKTAEPQPPPVTPEEVREPVGTES